jgi:uncharacterized DUF497 family protein
MPLRLSFDTAKDEANKRKHGLSLADAEVVYLSADKFTFASVRGSEQRKVDMAPVEFANAVLVLVYTERGEELRVISLRRASRQERRRYAKAREGGHESAQEGC